MRTAARCISAIVLLALGYLAGSAELFSPVTASAQLEAEPGLSRDAAEQVNSAINSLTEAGAALQREGLYSAATQGINAFAVTVGGVNALEDLEAGRGVDPETFAALYADMAIDSVAEHLGKDEQGRVTYKNKVVRLYPVSRLQSLFQRRMKLAGSSVVP